MKFNIRSLATFAMICFLTLFVGCGSGGGSSTGGSGGTGTLALSLTDAPSQDYEAVYVTIDKVEVHLGGNENNPNNWQEIPKPDSGVSPFVKKTFNLMDLRNGILEELGMTELPAGHYTQMRLFIGTEPDNVEHPFANYVIESGTTHELKVPSGYKTGIKLVKGFTVGENQLTELIIDFDATKSVVRRGNSGKDYILKPTIKVLGTEVLTYFIEGTVVDDDSGKGLIGVPVTAQVSEPAGLGDYPSGYDVLVKNTSITDGNGKYRLLVGPGTYNVVAYKDTYDFDFRCGVDTAAIAVSGETVELILRDIVTGVTDYGYVGGNVIATEDGTISFRAPDPECGIIEVTSKPIVIDIVEPPASQVVSYTQMLPVSGGSYYEMVASSGVTTEVVSGVTVESATTTFVNFDLVD